MAQLPTCFTRPFPATRPMSEHLVVIEREGDSWGAYCPDLPGVGVVGDTRDEVEQLIREAVALHLESLGEAGQQATLER